MTVGVDTVRIRKGREENGLKRVMKRWNYFCIEESCQ
jgi:hypothetical protein